MERAIYTALRAMKERQDTIVISKGGSHADALLKRASYLLESYLRLKPCLNSVRPSISRAAVREGLSGIWQEGWLRADSLVGVKCHRGGMEREPLAL